MRGYGYSFWGICIFLAKKYFWMKFFSIFSKFVPYATRFWLIRQIWHHQVQAVIQIMNLIVIILSPNILKLLFRGKGIHLVTFSTLTVHICSWSMFLVPYATHQSHCILDTSILWKTYYRPTFHGFWINNELIDYKKLILWKSKLINSITRDNFANIPIFVVHCPVRDVDFISYRPYDFRLVMGSIDTHWGSKWKYILLFLHYYFFTLPQIKSRVAYGTTASRTGQAIFQKISKFTFYSKKWIYIVTNISNFSLNIQLHIFYHIKFKKIG